MNTSDIEHMWKVATNNPNHDSNWHDPAVIKFAELVAAHTLLNTDPSSFMSWQEGYEAGKSAQNKELETLREYAAGRACTQAVIDALGPMSLWSKSGLEAEIRKAVEAEREACAKLVEDSWMAFSRRSNRLDITPFPELEYVAKVIRARKEN